MNIKFAPIYKCKSDGLRWRNSVSIFVRRHEISLNQQKI